jgi:phosphatidylglycerol:prolipoprotein diacylglycerol transferase
VFPVWIPLGPWRAHPHLVFELLAYVAAGAAYWRHRRSKGDPVAGETRWALASAAVVGALLGSRILFWFEDPARTLAQLTSAAYLAGGQTIVGGLIGGWIGVEAQKRRLGVTQPTGDLFAVPIALGTAVGRIGCFLSGLPDGTYGVASSLPWAVDLGDGIPRHPTALYESVFMAALAWWLARFARRAARGETFLALVTAYLTFRVVVEFWKPGVPIAAGLTAIQWASIAGALVAVRVWRRRPHDPPPAGETGTG